jgi:hypothetical protein
VDESLAGSVSVVVVDFDVGSVDGKLFKVWSAIAIELGI